MRMPVIHLLVAPVVVVAFALLAACATSDPGPGGPTVATPSTGGPVTGSPTPSTSSGELTIVVRDATEQESTWTLTCAPVGGTHPDPEAACAALTAHATAALPPVAKDTMCTQVYGGPETASITGTWQGRPVRSTFSRTNGCEIARWNMLKGLLPAASR